MGQLISGLVGRRRNAMTLLAGLLSAALFLYLFYALVKPEQF
jgi:K+-transporting ATPase KdpF subunit